MWDCVSPPVPGHNFGSRLVRFCHPVLHRIAKCTAKINSTGLVMITSSNQGYREGIKTETKPRASALVRPATGSDSVTARAGPHRQRQHTAKTGGVSIKLICATHCDSAELI